MEEKCGLSPVLQISMIDRQDRRREEKVIKKNRICSISSLTQNIAIVSVHADFIDRMVTVADERVREGITVTINPIGCLH